MSPKRDYSTREYPIAPDELCPLLARVNTNTVIYYIDSWEIKSDSISLELESD